MLCATIEVSCLIIDREYLRGGLMRVNSPFLECLGFIKLTWQ